MNTRPRIVPTRPKRLLALAALTVVSLLAAAPRPAAEASPAASASRAERVTIHNFSFHPGTIKIDRGDRVVWTNRDRVRHTATSRGSFSTGKIAPGASVAIRFKSRGTFRYHCTIHPEMTGKIVVR